MSTSTKAIKAKTPKTKSTKKAINVTTKKLFPYSGSKHKYRAQLQNVVSRLNVKKVSTYIEPFAGSLGSFFHIIEMIEADKIILNDINPKMTNIFQQIKDNPKQVAHAYSKLEDMFQSFLPDGYKTTVPKDKRHLMIDARDFYHAVRDYINDADFTANHAAAMIFVLNHNFNGLYNESKKGRFNGSFNWNAKRINYVDMSALIQQMHEILSTKNVEIYTMDVFELLHQFNDPDTFIYLDPPYIDNTIKYVADGFDLSLHNQMKLVQMTNKYNYVMYSNHHHEAFASFFGDYVNFYRTNKISKNSKKPAEIMAYKINKLSEAVNNPDFQTAKVPSAQFTHPMLDSLMDTEQKPANKSIPKSINPSDFTA
jgi:site-specific DNA-adenine methylase